jgi:SAM-dependent methyltransferase
MIKKLRIFFVSKIYGDHNSSLAVKKAIKKVLTELKNKEDIGLNIGAGYTRHHPQMKNLDIFPGENIDIIGRAEKLPVADESISLILTQETLEHVENPNQAVIEMYRVLKPNALVYCQLPFIIGYHPGPTDYWRFTKEGIEEIFTRNGFKVEEIGISVGGATGFYRIAVEFFASLLSIPLSKLYIPFKAFFSLFLYPIKWLDLLFQYSNEKDRIVGGYYIIAKK